jgi:hypothetical protein
VTVRSPLSEPAGRVETLADALASGPLPLADGLRCANEIAVELRDLHQQGRAHGKLTVDSIILAVSGARLAPLRNYWDQSVQPRDVQAFGAVFYQILTGALPPATPTAADLRVPGPRSGPTRMRSSAVMLALKCLASKGARLTMQQVATEIRLLGILLRQQEANARQEPAPVPFLVTAPPAAASASAVRAEPETDLPLSMREMAAAVEKMLGPGETGATPVVPLGRESFGRPTLKEPGELEPVSGHCPKCNSVTIYASRARSPFEEMLQSWGVPFCRCHRCYHRYVVFARLRITKDMPASIDRKNQSRQRSY